MHGCNNLRTHQLGALFWRYGEIRNQSLVTQSQNYSGAAFWGGCYLSELLASVELVDLRACSPWLIFYHKLQDQYNGTVAPILWTWRDVCRAIFRRPGWRVGQRNCHDGQASSKSYVVLTHDLGLAVVRWWSDGRSDTKLERRPPNRMYYTPERPGMYH
jgi:hypothetical protein